MGGREREGGGEALKKEEEEEKEKAFGSENDKFSLLLIPIKSKEKKKKKSWRKKKKKGGGREKRRAPPLFSNARKEKQFRFLRAPQTPLSSRLQWLAPAQLLGGAARLRSAALRGELCPGERERDEIWAGIAVIRE